MEAAVLSHLINVLTSLLRRRAPSRRARVPEAVDVGGEGGETGERALPAALQPVSGKREADDSQPATSPDVETTEQIQARLYDAVRQLRAGYAADDEDPSRVLRTLTHRGSHTIRQIPWAAQSVLTLLRRRGLGLGELTRVLEKDPSLSQLLLRHANSAFYAIPGEPVVSIKRAIQRVGTEGVHSVVMFQVIQGQLSRPGGQMDQLAKQVWKHMVRVAPLARDLAPGLGQDPERAFTLGLLHDVGKLVFFDHVADQRKQLRRDLRLTSDFVRGALASLHGLLGAMAVMEWGMDGDAASAVMYHHHPSESAHARPVAEILLVAEAMDLAQQRGDVLDVDALWEAHDIQGPKEPVAAMLEAQSQAA